MSIDRAKRALSGQAVDRIPMFDMPSHRGFVKKITGMDPMENPREAVLAAIRVLDIDIASFNIPSKVSRSDDPCLYGLEATIFRNDDFHHEDMDTYDPDTMRRDEPGMTPEACRESFRQEFEEARTLLDGVALPHGYTFTTCIHYAAEDLDWVEFLIRCHTDEYAVSRMLDRFEKASTKVMRAWSSLDIPMMCCHDDIAMTTGTVQNPGFLRRNLFPRYARLFRHFNEKGIPLLFMTDGNFEEVAADLAAAGADGFFIDRPCASLERIASICGKDKIYFTGPTPAIMTVGTPQDVRREVRELADIAKDLPRFLFHMPGGYAHNMPTENVQAWYDAAREYGMK